MIEETVTKSHRKTNFGMKQNVLPGVREKTREEFDAEESRDGDSEDGDKDEEGEKGEKNPGHGVLREVTCSYLGQVDGEAEAYAHVDRLGVHRHLGEGGLANWRRRKGREESEGQNFARLEDGKGGEEGRKL